MTVDTCLFDQIRIFSEEFLPAAAAHYEKTAPTVERHVDGIYRRMQKGNVTIREIHVVSRLLEDGVWLQANYAANLIYRLRSELGMDTTGDAGF